MAAFAAAAGGAGGPARKARAGSPGGSDAEEEVAAADAMDRLIDRLQRAYLGDGGQDGEGAVSYMKGLSSLPFSTRQHLCRRAPEEIEAVLMSMDRATVDMLRRSFGGRAMDLRSFVEAAVGTGTYVPGRLQPFVGGVVDLFLEVFWSHTEAQQRRSAAPPTISYGQLMNHLMERPEMRMWESQDAGGKARLASLEKGGAGDLAGAMGSGGGIGERPQLKASSQAPEGRHPGLGIEKLSYLPGLECLATLEQTQSIYLWPGLASGWPRPDCGVEPRVVTPNLPPEFNEDDSFSVISMAWDPEMQELAAITSNRLLIVWQTRSKAGGLKFKQKRALRFYALLEDAPARARDYPTPATLKGSSHFTKLVLMLAKPEAAAVGTDLQEQGLAENHTTRQVVQKFQEERQAADAAQLDIWYNAGSRSWVTGDRRGRLFFWDLRGDDVTFLDEAGEVPPVRILAEHTRAVTSHVEMGNRKFSTTSMDHLVIIWDSQRGYSPDVVIRDHQVAVISQAYLPLCSCLVTVGCECFARAWAVSPSGGFQGSRGRCEGHQDTVVQVVAGQKAFLTMDADYGWCLWDGSSLSRLQSGSAKGDLNPRHVVAASNLGRIVFAGRRFGFLDSNAPLALLMGVGEAGAANKQRALEEEARRDAVRMRPRWAGLSSECGHVLSATAAEVRLHARGSPDRSRVLFACKEGEQISAFHAMGHMALSVVGTTSGALHFLKYRSGSTSHTYSGGCFAAEGGLNTAAAIRAVKICDKDGRVYVGTEQGQVLVFEVGPGFPLLKQLAHAEDSSPVICLHRDAGLLAVGTQQGLVHVYTLDRLRFAGSVDTTWVLPEAQGVESAAAHAVHQVRLFAAPGHGDDPTPQPRLLTVSAHGRLLFWGLHLREQGDRLDRIELLLNGGSLQTGGRAELRSRQGRPPTRDRRPPTGGRPKTAPSGAHVTALAGVRGPISLPGKTLVAVPKAPVAQEAAAPPATPATRRRRVQMQSGPGSESEGEVENLAAARMRLRPPTRAGPAPPDAEADGRRFLYLGDADGKVFCLDLHATLEAAARCGPPVLQKPPGHMGPASKNSRSGQSWRHVGPSRAASPPASRPGTGAPGAPGDAVTRPGTGARPDSHAGSIAGSIRTVGSRRSGLGRVESPNTRRAQQLFPEALQLMGSWHAHGAAVVSLVPCGPPAALLSLAADNAVKIWSTCGQLWGDFSLVSGVVALWPPPHALASQRALMGAAKNICRLNGWVDRRPRVEMELVGPSPSEIRKDRKERSRLQSQILRAQTAPAPLHEAADALPAQKEEEDKMLVSTVGWTGDLGAREGQDARRRSTHALDSLDSPGTEEGAAAASPPVVEEAVPEEEVAEEVEEDAESVATERADQELTTRPAPSERMSSQQMREMIRSRAFSSGFQSYQKFRQVAGVPKTGAAEQLQKAQRRVPKGLDAMLAEFRERPTSGIGLRASAGTTPRTMGRRASSDGALLRHATQMAEEIVRDVQDNLHVDVSKMSKRQLRQASFIKRLDVGGVSELRLHDPNSATAQAALKLSGAGRKRRRKKSAPA